MHLMSVIKNISAVRRSTPSTRWVDITFDVVQPDQRQIVEYEVAVIPASGRIRKLTFPSKMPKSSECLTMKYLRTDMTYKFKVHAVYSDDTISKDVETAMVHGSRSHRDEALQSPYLVVNPDTLSGNEDHEGDRTLPEFVSDITISPKTEHDRENLVISWDRPKIADTWAHQNMGFRVELSVRTKVKIDETTTPDAGNCVVRIEPGQTYKVDVKMKYWDVDSDCMGEVAAKPLSYTAPPRSVDLTKIKYRWNDKTLHLKWCNVHRASSYEWEIYNQDHRKVGGGKTNQHDCTWSRHERCTSYIFKFQIKSITVKNEKEYASKTVMKEIPVCSNIADFRSDDDDNKTQRIITTGVQIIMKIGKKIKEDSTKWVYFGHFSSDNQELQREVAIKILGAWEYEERQLRFDGKNAEKRIVREAKHLLDLIQHPNVVQYIHSCGTGKGRIYIAMELCHGKTLEDRILDIADHTELRDPRYCKLLLLHVTQGLHYIHSKGIYHRDMKTSNILFSLDERVVKISDFGYSKKVNIHTGEPSATERTSTDGYRPPETYIDEEQITIDDRSDVFSLGLVYFVVLSGGKHPFGDDVVTRSYNIMRNTGKVLQSLTGPFAALAKDLIQDMLNFKQTERPKACDILKHPYFWSPDKVVNFYTKVVDQISVSQSLKEIYDEGIVTRDSLANEFATKLQCPSSTIGKIVSHKYFSMNVENQVGLYFLIAKNAAEAAKGSNDLVSENGDDFYARLGEVNRKHLVGEMLSSPFFHSLDKQAQFCIRVIHSIPAALEEIKLSTRQSEDCDSGSSFNSEGTKSECNKNTQDDFKCAENEILTQSDFSTLNDDYITLAKEVITQILRDSKNIRPLEETLAVLQNASAIPGALLPYIEGTQSNSGSSSPSVVFFSQEDVTNEKKCNSRNKCDKVTCSCPRLIPLADELVPHEYLIGLKKIKKEIKQAVKDKKIKETLDIAASLIEFRKKYKCNPMELHPHRSETRNVLSSFKANLSTTDKLVQLESSRSNHVKSSDTSPSEKRVEKLSQLNNLKLIRRRDNENNWTEFEQLVDNFKEAVERNAEEYLCSIHSRVTELVEFERDGEQRTWKYCLRDELMGHGINCPCIKFVENTTGVRGDEIFELIKYIRNKLVHFEDTKRSLDGNWMKHQEEILNVVAAAVPELLPHMFRVMKKELADFIDKNKQQESSFFLPPITRNSQ